MRHDKMERFQEEAETEAGLSCVAFIHSYRACAECIFSFEAMLLYLFLNVPVIPVAMFSPVFYRTRGLHGMVDLISNVFYFILEKRIVTSPRYIEIGILGSIQLWWHC